MLETGGCGKDLDTVQSLNKKHKLLEVDIKAHEDRLKNLNKQTDFLESEGLDKEKIKDKTQSINTR